MNKLLLLGIALLLSAKLSAQINVKDSTVQVIGYWEKQETQSYTVSYEKIKVKSNDTLSRDLITYEVDIKILDSTQNSYTIEWFYKNYAIDTENALAQKLATISSDLSVIIKTDELGAFLEIINADDIKTHLEKVTKTLKEELKNIPNSEKLITNAMNIYTSKESIQANAIKDVMQFYQFHGVKYKLGEELEGLLETANNYGDKPFDTNVRFSLDEINEVDGNSIFRSNHIINSNQLTDATYNYLKNSGNFGDNFPQRDKFPSLTNITNTASRIHGETGWLIYSIETKEISAEASTNIEERIIEII
ncbi:hypothetical protein [Mariniflexile sp. AS56]|uniref:hypothetical protein n=1 Tax=Mariniflexile sp. AS56 TaxID=3063957 RepID=UPI0026E9A130|nr:hypothetical protein [Mariniflexile sp. AS56]MDO7172936.1 hypothetical protein [Mariniflexile sp. AS56]